jgi:hypothetical protein
MKRAHCAASAAPHSMLYALTYVTLAINLESITKKRHGALVDC